MRHLWASPQIQLLRKQLSTSASARQLGTARAAMAPERSQTLWNPIRTLCDKYSVCIVFIAFVGTGGAKDKTRSIANVMILLHFHLSKRQGWLRSYRYTNPHRKQWSTSAAGHLCGTLRRTLCRTLCRTLWITCAEPCAHLVDHLRNHASNLARNLARALCRCDPTGQQCFETWRPQQPISNLALSIAYWGRLGSRILTNSEHVCMLYHHLK